MQKLINCIYIQMSNTEWRQILKEMFVVCQFVIVL